MADSLAQTWEIPLSEQCGASWFSWMCHFILGWVGTTLVWIEDDSNTCLLGSGV